MIASSMDFRVRKSFSKAAVYYEEFAWLQKEIGLRLMDQIREVDDSLRVLDVGMGTGWLTSEFSQKYPRARIVGMDSAFGMVVCAKKKNARLSLMQADACALPFKDDTFDAAVSNLVYQWIEDLPGAFRLIRKVLKKNGLFYFSCLGEKTLKELFFSLEQSLDDKGKVINETFRKFANQQYVVNSLLRNGFKDIDVQSKNYKVSFPDIFALIRWLKNIGANTPRYNVFVGKDWLLKANDFYKTNFCEDDRMIASFEVFWVKAKIIGKGETSLSKREG